MSSLCKSTTKMDTKILILGLLVITVGVFSAYGGPVAGAEETTVKQDKGASEENYQNQIQENRIEMISSMANTQSAKAKELLSTANAYSQVTNERRNYYNEYKKLAESAETKAKETEQKAASEAASVDGFESRRSEWDSRSREADSHAKNEKVQEERYRTEAQELFKRIEAATLASNMAEARAAGLLQLANSERLWSVELRGKADELNDVARNHYSKAKEAEEKANAEKVKAQQHAAEAEKHSQAANSLQEQAIKAEVASQNNLAKYITTSLKAEADKNHAKEQEMSATMEDMVKSEKSKRAEVCEAIIKILEHEIKYYMERAKKEEATAYVYSQTARDADSTAIAHGATVLKLATAKEDSEIESEDLEPNYFGAEQLKTMPFVAHKIID